MNWYICCSLDGLAMRNLSDEVFLSLIQGEES